MQGVCGRWTIAWFLVSWLAACTSGEQPATPRASGVGEKAAETAAKHGGYLVLPSPEPPLVNPILQQAFDMATPLIFEGLVGLDAKMELVPVLAESWTRSTDGKSLTFHLRRNVLWHDGKPFTSADVVFTLEQIRAGRAPSNWRSYLTSVEKIEAPNPDTVNIIYKGPFGPDLATFTVGILPKHLYEGKSLADAPANLAPVGTGAWKFVRWVPGKEILLDANPGYWGGRPNFDQVMLVFDVARKDYLKALRASPSRLDFAEVPELDDWTGVVATPEFREKYETGTVNEAVLAMIAWNCQKKPFDNPKVRVALSHALDRPRVIEDVLRGNARPLSGPFYPTMWGGDPSVAPWPFDLAKAGALFDEAGLKAKGKGSPRLNVELLVAEERRGPLYDQMLAIFRSDLESIGVDLQVTYLKRNDLIARLILHNFDAALYEWSPDIADPDPYVFLHSSQVNEGANYAGYVSPDADKLLEEGRRSTDRGKRKASYYTLHKLVHGDEPYTFLYAPQTHYAWSRRIRGANPIDASTLSRWPGIARWSVER